MVMSKLATYRAKRRFMRTPEPWGIERPSDPDNLTFVIQQHFATRVHFDLRLEWEGTLMSWAIPEGPSVNTRDRRLAIRTEDHPVDYAGFEGEIPEGEYGGGRIVVWDRGIWVPVTDPPDDALDAGELKFRLAGEKLKGGWTLVKLPKGESEWLFIKERDTGARATDILAEAPGSVLKTRKARPPGKVGKLPDRVAPQLASQQATPPTSAGWIHEIKYDGYRSCARIENGNVRILTRNGHDWTEKYTSVAFALAGLDCRSAMIDGEIVVQDGRGATSFTLLQHALAGGRDDELVFYAFDLLFLNGRDLRSEPLTCRKDWLRRLIPNDEAARVQYSDSSDGDGPALFAQACWLGLEGVVSKRADAPYCSGRSPDWIKAKRYDVGRFAVVGFTTKASPRHVASLLLAEEDTLAYVGRVGSGFDNEKAAALFESLRALEVDTATIDAATTKDARWIPTGRMVAEVAFRGRTGAGAVRQASLLKVEDTAPRPKAAPRRQLVTNRDLAAIRLTNPDREFFDGSGTTKLDIALYYARVGDAMLPQLLDRPVTLIRCTTGRIEDCFYQRHAMQGLPEGVEVVGDPKLKEYLVIRNARGFLGLTQFGTIEFHPWDCRADDLKRPDRFTLDLDPGEGVDWPTLRSAALDLRERLVSVGLTPFVRVTGSKGLHLVVPLKRKQAWTPVKAYLRSFAKTVAEDSPRLFVSTPRIAERKGRIYLDVNRTARGTSAVASYSLRARLAFNSAMTLAWDEVQHSAELPVFDRFSAINRVERGFNPWDNMADARATINRKARRDVGIID